MTLRRLRRPRSVPLPGAALAVLLALAPARVASAGTRLVLESLPDGITFALDGDSIGTAPLETAIPAGAHRLVAIGYPDHRFVASGDTLPIVAVEGETLRVVFDARRTTLVTHPYGATVRSGGPAGPGLGRTPLAVLPARFPGAALFLALPGHRPVRVAADSLRGVPVWEVDLSPIPGVRAGPEVEPSFGGDLVVADGRRDHTLDWILGGTALGLVVAGVAVKGEANRRYDLYLATADHDRLEGHFRDAERLDRVASGLYIAGEVAAGILVYRLVRRAGVWGKVTGDEKPPSLELHFTGKGAGVRLRY